MGLSFDARLGNETVGSIRGGWKFDVQSSTKHVNASLDASLSRNGTTLLVVHMGSSRRRHVGTMCNKVI